MPVVHSLMRRLRGDDLAALRAEVAELRQVVLQLNQLMSELNHDVRSGSEQGLPLFLGYAERFRTDADTVVGASAVIERQLQRLTEQVDRIAGPTNVDG